MTYYTVNELATEQQTVAELLRNVFCCCAAVALLLPFIISTFGNKQIGNKRGGM